jgi:hypothetical protein
MSTVRAELHGFAYGEDLESMTGRSLGYRLLAPAEPTAWRAEVEALAHRLQAAPDPDHWPPTDLFCSVLVADGRRLIALARYGLADHTPSQRRGGLELVGVVGPASADVPAALAVYQWLKRRRAEAEDLRSLGGVHALADVVAAAAPPPAVPADPTPVLPVRIWHGGALLFAATTPSDPDHRLSLLEQGAGPGWQWLPLVGPDFPLPAYAERGPLVAWTPHLAGVAVKLDPRPAHATTPRPVRGRSLFGGLAVALLLLLVGLSAANLWLLHALSTQLAAAPPPSSAPAAQPDSTGATARVQATAPGPAADVSRDRFAEALHDLLMEQGGRREWGESQAQLLAQYERLAREHKDLRLRDDNTKGKVAVAAVNVLSQRSADRVEGMVKKALSDKGFHPNVVKTACEFVHDELSADARDGR